MPTYDYECQSCEHRFEKYQAITAKPVRTCPRCGRRKVRRLIGAGAGILFKGSGFYQTDYRSESYRKAAEKDKSGQKGSETGKKPSDETGKKPSDSKAPTDAPAKSEPGEKAEKHS